MTQIYIVGWASQGFGNTQVEIVAVYTNKQKADQLRQELQDKQKGGIQFLEEYELDPVTVNV